MNLLLSEKEIAIRSWWKKTIKGVKNGNVLKLERGSFNEDLYQKILEIPKQESLEEELRQIHLKAKQ